jgi:hypothetical protein
VIAIGHYVCQIISLPPVFMPLTSFKLPICGMQFHQSFFQVGNGLSSWDNTQTPFNYTLPHWHDVRNKILQICTLPNKLTVSLLEAECSCSIRGDGRVGEAG